MEKKLLHLVIWSAITVLWNSSVKADNISVGKLASQAGDYHREFYHAWLAVDGNTGQDKGRGYQSCARVYTDSKILPLDRRYQPAWWAVGLANGDPKLLFVIKNVTIYFEKDVTLEGSIKHNTILVGNDPDWWNQTQCASISKFEYVQTVPCTPPIPVRYLTIRHPGIRNLTFCEVVVNGHLYEGSAHSMPSSQTVPSSSARTIISTTAPETGSTTTPRSTLRPQTQATVSTSTPVTGYIGPPTVTPTEPTQTQLPTGKSDLPIIVGLTAAGVLIIGIIIIIICFLSRRTNEGKRKKSEHVVEKTANSNPNKHYEEIDELPSSDPRWHKGALSPEDQHTSTSTKHGIPDGYLELDNYYDPPVSQKGNSGDDRRANSGEVNAIPEISSPKDYQSLQDPSLIGPSYQAIVPKGGSLLPDIRVSDLKKYINSMKEKASAFEEEFTKLPVGPSADWNEGNGPEDKKKKRYWPSSGSYDNCRVILGNQSVSRRKRSSDFIDASYISGCGGATKAYIAAQAPTNNTVIDMWQMIWEANSNRIILFAVMDENGKMEYDPYWPNEGSEVYGSFKVTHVKTEVLGAFTSRTFGMKLGEQSKMVHQFHFTDWPAQDTVPTTSSLLAFRKSVMNNKDGVGPPIVHCSNGVGRTGTYIAIDRCLQQADEEGVVNVWGTVYQMRTERFNMVESLEQYKLVYDVLLDYVERGMSH